MNDIDLWRGEMARTTLEHERRLNAINGHVDALRTTIWRWSGAITILVLIANVLVAWLVTRL